MLFVKFIIVGILNTLFGYGIFALMLYLGLHYAIAVILATIIGILFNFKTTGYIVFKSNDNKLIWKFLQVYTLTMFLNIIGLKFAKTLGLDLYISGFVLIGMMAVINFLLFKVYVFKK